MSELSWKRAVHGQAGLHEAEHPDATVEDVYPLTPMQQAMLLSSRRDPGGGFYIQQFVLSLREPLTPEFRAAWRRLAARHPALRTSFLMDAHPEPLQRVHARVVPPWREHDWRGVAADAREEAWRAFLREDRATPFALDTPPLMRFALFRFGDDDYRLLWSSHHALLDAYARRLVLREVFDEYDLGREPAAGRRPFGEYARWLQSAERPDTRAFWEEALRGFTAPNQVAGDAGEAGGREQGERRKHRFALSAALSDALRELARREGVTVNTVLQGAWALLLGRYTGDRDVVFGAPRSCRGGDGFPGVGGVVGLVTNTVPVRVRLEEGRAVSAHLAEIRSLWVRMRPHERSFLSRVQEWSEVPGGTPLFQTLLNFERAATREALRRPGEERWDRRGFELLQWISYPLAVLAHGGPRISVEMIHDPARIPPAAIRRMGGHLTRILRAFAADPAQPLGRIDLLGPSERRRLLHALNPAPAPFAGPGCVHALVQAQAARTPERVAVVDGERALTFGELDARSNQLARALARRGVGPEARVAVCIERSAELVIALVAILKAGGAYVPLDPDYPRDRLAFVLEDAGAALLLCQAHLAGRLPPGGPARMVAEPLWAQAAGESAAPVDTPVDPDNLAYVIYTSGSTGRPKGAMNAHRGVANRLLWMREAHGVGAGDVVLQKTPYSFDVSVWELFWPLVAGARMVLARPGGHRDPAYLREVIERERVTTVHFVPSMLDAFLEAGGADAPALRRVVCSGEALSRDLQARFLARFPGVALHNLYGPTEAAVDVTFWACRPDHPCRTVPIGRPVANTRLYVLDTALRPVPAGVPGELCIGGVQVARGYLGRPGLTAERFAPDPFAAVPGARLYRTGDRARWLADGALEYLGRLDQQVKIRGFRIEPGEIEAVLRAHPGVHDAAVAVYEHAPGDRRLAAWVIPDAARAPAPHRLLELRASGALGGHEAETPAGDTGVVPLDPREPGRWHSLESLLSDVREEAAARLPEYMVPAAFVPLASFPLTPSGKLDRARLPSPGPAAAERPYAAPRTPAQEVLAGLFAAVLGVERVGVEDDFFALGGHSLLATRLAVRVREALGVELPLHALFDAPTVEALAGVAAALRPDGRSAADVPPVTPAPRGTPLPLSFAQERLWFIHRLDPHGAAYNVPVFLRLEGPLDAAALERALGEVVRRHQVLRTTFPEVDGAPVQAVAPPAPFALPVRELPGLEAAERVAAAGRLAAEEAARPFDLLAGPVFRAGLLRLGDEEHVLLLVLHHIVSDGWSLDVLFRELSALYRAYRAGDDSPLPELAVQYADHAVWQRQRLRGEALERPLAYWKERLAGAPALLELPTDHPRPAEPSFRGDTVPVALPAALAERLRALGRREGATPFMVLLAAFQLVLGRHAGSDDVVVGSPIAGRTRREVEPLIGFFVNTLALRADLSGDPAFRALLRRVREGALGAYEHQEVPFEKLVAELQPGRTLSHSPLFQVTFALHDAQGRERTLAGVRVTAVEATSATAKFDLSLALEPDPDGGLRGGLTYATDLFERPTVRRLAARFQRVLEQVAGEPGRRISALELMSPAERARVVEGWRPTTAAAPRGSIHGRFEARARQTPDSVALVSGGESLTYAELDARAGRLARALRRRGVAPETRVGLCLERSARTVVAILGVLKAGGAYVPIDPAYPPERIAWLLEDSGVALVLAEDATRAALPPSAPSVLTLDELLSESHHGETAARSARVEPEGAAYVIYTSGSTGRPKGVVVTHASVLRLFDSTEAWFGFGPGDVWTLFHSYAFDFSVWEIWGALLYGGRVVVVPFLTSRDPAAFRALLAREGVTVLSQTPSAFRQLVQADQSARGELALRWVVFGGEALEPRALKPWFHRHGDARPRLVNMYGITETTVHVTFRPLSAADADAGGSMIGEPIPDLGVYLLDARLEPVPPGAPGEIFVGGAGAARGYLGRPALTAERFLPDPFSGVAGARMYRSGDRARRRAGGDTEYLGRGDQQLKVRGFRIEPGEIEAALLAQPGVREALVVAREDEPGARRLVAYLVADGEPSAAALRAALAARLPDYMVPAAFVPLRALPLTPHGKVDRRALPQPGAGELASAEWVAPRGVVEEALARVWAETLGVERVGARDNYFALGGDSMRAIRALALARARGIPFSLPDLFRHQTVAELAERIHPTGPVDGGADRYAGPFSLLSPADRALVPAEVEDAYPMTQLQLGMLYHSESRPGDAVYHNVQSYRVHAAFDEARLRGALAALAARHPVLRTSFDLAGFSEPMQLVRRRVELPLEVTALEQLAPGAQRAALAAWAHAERARPFDWRVAPLIRFHAHTLGPGVFRLGFAEHHAILDGWSVAAMLAELFALYRGGAAPAPAPPAAILPGFVALEREVLARPEARAFWAGRLDGAEPTLPALLGGAGGEGRQARIGALPAEVAAGLAAAARAGGLPLKSLLLAAHLRVLAAASGERDVTTGVVVNGRPEEPGAERALGLFLNTIPCRLRLSGGSWLELARAAFDEERGALPFRRFPVAELQRMRGGEAPFAALFTFVDFGAGDAVAVKEGSFGGDRGWGATNFAFDTTFEAVPGGGVRLALDYDAARYSAAEADALFERYLQALERIAADPHGRYDDALAGADAGGLETERADELPELADTLHGLVAAQAARTPRALALECGARTLTFAALERRALALARELRRRGVGPEARVALCCSRSIELVVGTLAVMRAGGALVPLDPAYPPERLAYVLGDAGARLLLTDAETAAVANAAAGPGVETLRLDAASPPPDGGEADWPPVDPRNAAYVIYTSGSTGRPKGVVVEHGPAAAHMMAYARYQELSPADRVLHSAPAGFDQFIEDIFVPLVRGAAVVLREGDPWDPAEWVPRVRALGITVANITPAYWGEVTASAAGAELPELRLLLVGADTMPSGSVRAWRQAVRSPARMFNGYGPTEAVVTATAWEVPADYPGAFTGPVVPIGPALPGRACRVLDPFGAPAAAGVPGELCLGGELLARGYLGRPGLTAERFVPDPYPARPGARMYRSGDRSRRLASGAIEFLGRVDTQVKVRGYRIEPGEVEAALARHPAVREAVVVARGEGEARRLVAYLLAAPGHDAPSAAELRAHLRERLPAPMVPSAFVTLEAFPLTAHAKLDRRALPAPQAEAGDGPRVFPRDALELRLARLWEEVLGTGPVGVRDDFFEVGGHSLAALRLLASLERLTGRRVPLATLLAAPTVERLALFLRGGEPLAAPGPLVPITSGGEGRPLFFVHAAGGNVASYAALARHLGPGQPFYGLQSRGVEGGEPLHGRVEAMAADYLAALRQAQPAGPYRLGGWSMGGLVAWEMARGLEAAGEAVELLALVDTPAPAAAPADGPDAAASLAGFLLHLGLAPEQLPAAAGEADDERLRRAWEAARAADAIAEGLELDRFARLWSVYRANVAAAAAYEPGPCAANLLLVMAGDRAAGAALERARWGALTTGAVRTAVVAGDHFSLVREPAVRELAALLSGALASAPHPAEAGR